MIELKNLANGEIEPFFNSLRDEKYLSEMFPDMISTAKFIAVARIDKELAGIAGIVLGRFNIPILFISIKPQFRRRGLGNKMMQNIIAFTKENYSCLTLSTYKSERYKPAINLYLKNEFKIFCEPCNQYFMGLPFNRRGEILCRLLSIIFTISCSPVGHILRGIRSICSHWIQPLSKSFRQ